MCSGGLVRSVIAAGGAEIGTGQAQEHDSQDNIYTTTILCARQVGARPPQALAFPSHTHCTARGPPKTASQTTTYLSGRPPSPAAWSALLPGKTKTQGEATRDKQQAFLGTTLPICSPPGGRGKGGGRNVAACVWGEAEAMGIVRPNQSSFPARRRPSAVPPPPPRPRHDRRFGLSFVAGFGGCIARERMTVIPRAGCGRGPR